ncbi:MAG: sugar-binding transcriptional regulator, partial [Rhizobiaceae bacterium]
MPRQETATTRLDDAARAGWLYYVAGNSQEQIARKLGVSRQTAQRLVSMSVSEGLVRVRLEHPIGRCMELASQLRQRYALEIAEVVPTDPDAPDSIHGVAIAAATEIERWLRNDKPVVMAIGTGRTLKSAIEQLTPMEAPQHKIVSLTGSIAPDGSAAFYNVIFNIAEAVKARSFPMPLPVIASSAAERDMLLSQPMIKETHALAQQAD